MHAEKRPMKLDEAKEALKVTSIEIQEGIPTKAQFSGLTPGSYAISAIHDENRN